MLEVSLDKTAVGLKGVFIPTFSRGETFGKHRILRDDKAVKVVLIRLVHVLEKQVPIEIVLRRVGSLHFLPLGFIGLDA